MRVFCGYEESNVAKEFNVGNKRLQCHYLKGTQMNHYQEKNSTLKKEQIERETTRTWSRITTSLESEFGNNCCPSAHTFILLNWESIS